MPRIRFWTVFAAFLAICLGALMLRLQVNAADSWPASQAPRAPEFSATGQADWINSRPLKLADLSGKVVLIDVWTFECWNCYRSFPWLNDMESRLAPRGLQVVGIHSPEFAREHDPAAVRRKTEEFGLRHPVMLDNDFRYWKALGNQYWPAYYLIDKQGRIRARFVGETHKDSSQARLIEQTIEALIRE